jgi:hypothetical protein
MTPEQRLGEVRRKADDESRLRIDGKRNRQIRVWMLHRLGASYFETWHDARNERLATLRQGRG